MKKRILSIVLTLCLVLSIGAVGASAQQEQPKVLICEGERLTITPESYTYDSDDVTHQFTGDYILGGFLARLIFSGGDGNTYNITVHELDVYAVSDIPIYFENSNTTVNLTVYGQFCSHSVIASVGCADGATNNKIKITFAEGGLVNWTVTEGTPVGEGVSIVDSNDASLISSSEDPKVFLAIEGEQAIYHKNSVIKGENGCVYDCPDCDLVDGITAPHTPGETGTYINDNICEMTCVLCDNVYEDIHEYEGDRYVSDEICGEYCRYCDEVFAEYDHSLEYTPAEGGHTAYCDFCEYEWDDVMPHTPSYFWIDTQTCGATCDDCGETMGESISHSYKNGEYVSMGNEGCVLVCDNCGEFDYEDTSLLKAHDFSAYEPYDNENCVAVCSRCEYWQEDDNEGYVLRAHSFGEPVSKPATAYQEEHTVRMCEYCSYEPKEYNKEKSIVIEMPTYYFEEDGGFFDEMGGLAVYRNGKLWQHVYNINNDINALPFDKNASYVFKLLNTTTPETALTIWIPGMENPLFQSENLLEDGYEMFDTVAAYNMADYSGLQEALDTVPDDMSIYTEASAMAVANVVRNIIRMRPASSQTYVDKDTEAVKTAVAGLVKRGETDPAHGVVHVKNTSVDIYPDHYTVFDTGSWEEIQKVDYDGDYVLFGTRVMDEVGKEDYSKGAFWVCDGAEKAMVLANLWSVGTDGVAGIVDNSSAEVTLYGSNVIADGSLDYYDYAGINVSAGNSITINGNGSLLALGQDNCAGIGGKEKLADAGDITINGGTVFAFSAGDAAGIGGGYKGKAGNITINGGTVYANCLHDDAPGIGTGEDGKGGTVTIHGGHVTALSYDDDGAGIGSGDTGHIDAITINGGTVIAGSDDGAAIGGGSDDDGYGGKIVVNGGVVLPHVDHDSTEYFMGNGDSGSKGLAEDNFVQINGGVVITQGTKGIYPVKSAENGNTVTSTDITPPSDNHQKDFYIVLENGSVALLTPVNGKVTVFGLNEPYALLGDLNDDGKIDAKDALVVLRIAVEKVTPTKIQQAAADVTTDGSTNAKDALEILKYAVEKPSALAK